MRWLKNLLTGRKDGVKADWHGAAGKETTGRWSFVKQRKSGADGRKPRPSEAGLAAVRPCHCVGGEEATAREEKAAVVVQKAFRGYLARKALRALRSLVKLQALVRGYLVRKQAATTLHRLQALMRLQADSYAVKRASYRKSMEQVSHFSLQIKKKREDRHAGCPGEAVIEREAAAPAEAVRQHGLQLRAQPADRGDGHVPPPLPVHPDRQRPVHPRPFVGPPGHRSRAAVLAAVRQTAPAAVNPAVPRP